MALRDITLGQYFPGDSPIHRLDPRAKLIAMICYIVALFLGQWFVTYAVLFLALAAAVEEHPAPVIHADNRDHGASSTFTHRRMRMVAAWARVALPPGTRRPSMPPMSPVLTDHAMASRA